ncbi:DNA mismatch repair protein MutS [Striga asiatica]|uniref:DNA mismatch repair protein MutS n=1 Tax=Striga asiatica TaxID=4170 RepID=A0A5A7QAG9_STRAF|nr:DNA mismatch repair protein MutS [Striga asiatica]
MPRLSTPITQDECLYDARWTKQADNVFVDFLIESHMLGKWKNGRPGGVVFYYCCGFLIGELDLIYSHAELEERFDFLQKRYQEDLRFMFEEVYSTHPTSEVVHDRNSTYEGFFALPAARTNVVSDNSYHNALQTLCSRNYGHPQHGGPHDASSESSINTHAHVLINRVGSRTPLRISRPPHKPDPTSCKGSTSDPPV